MKNKILALLIAVIVTACKYGVKTLPFVGGAEVYAQWTSGATPADTSWFVQRSPVPPTGQYKVIRITPPKTSFRSARVFWDSVGPRNNSIPSNARLLWVDSATCEMKGSRVDSIRIKYSQLTGTPNIPGTPTLSINQSTLSIVGGNSVTLPSFQTSVTAGTGISVSNGSVVTNTLPDQTVNITAGTNITLSGSYPNFTVSASKRQETYSGSTNSSGVYSATFATAYASAPNVQANIVPQASTNQFIRVSAVSTTGFTVNVFQRNSINLLGTDLLLFSTVNVNGASVDVLITEK